MMKTFFLSTLVYIRKVQTLFFVLLTSLLTVSCAVQVDTNSDKLISDASSLVLHADMSSSNQAIGEVFDFFDVSVRTQNASVKSTPATFGRRAKVNTVRMLGGWRSKNLDADTYKWNGEQFVYDFEQATNRIDAWLNNDWDIFQIVLDNPPWAFQRGYTFVDEADGKNYLSKDAVGVYGNVLPPADPAAWHKYIKAFIQHLVATYGKQTVLSWRFRVGSEIDTRPQHWSATRQAFFDHYKNTVDALHAVLPEAQVGAHFREASFKGRYVDYTGNTEDSYGIHFIQWAKANNVAYDFIAVSYYPHIHKPQELDMTHVYSHDMAPIHQHPDWDPTASFEIHEFKLISKMQKAGFVSVATSHSSSFFAMMAKMMLENKVANVFQWGTARNGQYIPEAMTQLALHSMLGNDLYANNVIGQPAIKGNVINGIFTKKAELPKYDILLFNFNHTDLSYQIPETIKVLVQVDSPVGTQFKYRRARIDATNNHTDRFYADYPQSLITQAQGGWRLDNIHETASIDKALNEKGKRRFNDIKSIYPKNDQLIWDEWQIAVVTQNDRGQTQLEIQSQLLSFAVQKIELQATSQE